MEALSFLILNIFFAVLVTVLIYFFVPADFPYFLWGKLQYAPREKELLKQKRIGCFLGFIFTVITQIVIYFICR